ncbi:hypothetical protein PVAND_011716 [Polypedilum vanderplanki]|uniref:Uncharacterized protein n=1 Tax=Polypedilum vanderplanki TaxID=319348 RepID=A0A9J6CKA9_POLVA|nr:hypothetical protein PVAND_011716 [Polypedilum vanderplanki]
MHLKELSGPLIVLLLSGTILTATIFIIFAKRQITRYSLRSRHTPHAPIGNSANKQIKREIERRLNQVDKLFYEPQLLLDDDDRYISHLPPYYYRMKAIDDLKLLEKEIPIIRGSRDSLRSFLVNYFSGTSQKLINQYCDSYEHARYDPNEFNEVEYQKYHHLLLKMIEVAKLTKQTTKSPSKNRTPTKKSKIQPLLDPSRLKPPATQMMPPETRNSQLNLSIALQQQQLEDENEILSVSHTHDLPKIEIM